MLRKFGTVALVAAFMVVVGISGAAAQVGVPGVPKTIHVNAEVGAFSVFTCSTYMMTLDDFFGFAYETRDTGPLLTCHTEQNSDVTLTLEISALTHADAGTPIGTAVTLAAPLYSGGSDEGEILLITGPWNTDKGNPPKGFSGYDQWDFAEMGQLALVGPAKRPIFVNVEGKLNEIGDQPAGQYKTKLLVTVSD